jgi:hypothetical protein
MIKEALNLDHLGKKKIGGGLITIEMSLDKTPHKTVHRPFEEEVRRDVVCPHCGLDQSVYGLATWCSDCGEDIFLTHVRAELSVVQTMLEDIQGRRERLGGRVAAKDIENCLEDIVSIFEVVLKAFVVRYKLCRGLSYKNIDQMRKKMGIHSGILVDQLISLK